MVIRQRQTAREQIDPAVWKRADMRAALAERDIAAVFKLLQRTGVSQRHIAALTGQSQSEISEILAGRQVSSYELLVRIADGLGVPRGSLGLAYDDATTTLLGLDQGAAGAAGGTTGDELLTAFTDPLLWSQPFHLAAAHTPDRIGLDDVARLAAMTDRLRSLDHQHGGGASHDAAVAQLTWAHQLLRARADDETKGALHRAMADLHMVAGWTAFDLGLLGPARRHYARALDHARFVEEQTLVATVLYRMGRLHLHHGWTQQAIRLFQLGQVAAQESGQGRPVAMLHANLAWAYAVAGDGRQALACVGRARDEYGRSEHEEAPNWLGFFDLAELQALRGMALAHLPEADSLHRAEAIDRFSYSAALRELPIARSRTFELTALAWLLIDQGELEHGLRIGHEAVDLAATIRSQRVIDRMGPLRASLGRRKNHSDARDLIGRIGALR